MNRRDMLKLAGVATASTVMTGCAATNGAEPTKMEKKGGILNLAAPLPTNGTKQRVVVVGGGWSGLSVAKRLKQYIPDLDVVLIEKRAHFVSCPISNLWLVDAVNLEFLTHSYLDSAENNGYTFFNATVYDVDKKAKLVHTNEGTVNYDYLVLAPGIDYDYSQWTKGDADLEYELRTHYPPGFMIHSEHQTIKEKLENFEEGNFILTVPGGNYRCLPAPYERACLIAEYFKKNEIEGKVILLDENPDITIKKKGFHSAFDEMYKDYIEYVPSAKIEKFDLKNKKIETEFDEYTFADAAFYPRVRGNKLLEVVGVSKHGINKGEADIDPFTYQVKGEPYIFCSGDVRPMGFSKSGNTSNSEGYVVARIIANRILGKKDVWKSPHTTCYSAVAVKPSITAISVNTDYAWSDKNHSFSFYHASTMENWHGKSGTDTGKGLIEWAKGMYRDMFM